MWTLGWFLFQWIEFEWQEVSLTGLTWTYDLPQGTSSNMDQTFNAVFTRGIGNQVQLYLIEALTHSHSIQLTIIVNNQSLISLNFWRGLRIYQIFSGFN